MLFGMVSFLYLGIMGIVCVGVMQIPFVKRKINTYLDSFEEFED